MWHRLEVLNEGVDIQEIAAAAIAKLTPINKFLELSNDDDDFQKMILDETDETGSYTNIDRIRNNDLSRFHQKAAKTFPVDCNCNFKFNNSII
ncbi:hypothetical protein RclHR1_22960001 [Rhizophagus clarus]|uniref:Uncharacterized protein n=1 Tax=Rhizophagus clarus TaxID=94130 RepID=A0A2Z6QX32_9GLOM|nr:hypothetical protein RclHR1_22960001 [Rhizophagus clarus]GES93760.1 hypothetical protein GLOIN_2v1840951 [Rhizophagus clarus]